VTIPESPLPDTSANEESDAGLAAPTAPAGNRPLTPADTSTSRPAANPDATGFLDFTGDSQSPATRRPPTARPRSTAEARRKPRPANDNDDGTNVSMVWTALVGLAATGAFYALLLPVPDMYFRDLFYNRGWVTVAETFLMFWSFGVLAFKWAKLRRQRQSMLFDLLPDSIGREITVANVPKFTKSLRDLPVNPGSSFLVQRVLRGLEHFSVRRSASEVSTVLASQSDLDNNAVSSSYSLLNVFIWAIPILGFIGTVQGLGQAVGNLSGSLQGATDIESVKGALGGITSGLGVAFDTTLVALIMALFLKFPASSLQKAEEDLLNWVDEYCNENLLKRLQDNPHADAPTDAASRTLQRAIDAALVPHHAELRAWQTRLQGLGQSLTEDITRGWSALQQDLQAQHVDRTTQLQEILKSLGDTTTSLAAAIGQLGQLQQAQVDHVAVATQAVANQAETLQRQAEEHQARLAATSTDFLGQTRQAVTAVATDSQAAQQQIAQAVQQSASEAHRASDALGQHFQTLQQAVGNLNEVLGQLDGKQVVIQTTGRPRRGWNLFGRRGDRQP
jgi:biopolymer transport protein ExbB/TolQ